MATATEELHATPATSSKNYNWTLEAFERQGKLWLRWDSNTTFRPAEGQLRVYKNQEFPEYPNQDSETAKKTYDTVDNREWNTGLAWGADWYCAYIARIRADDPSYDNDKKLFAYVVQVVTD